MLVVVFELISSRMLFAIFELIGSLMLQAFKALLSAATAEEQLSALGELMYQVHVLS